MGDVLFSDHSAWHCMLRSLIAYTLIWTRSSTMVTWSRLMLVTLLWRPVLLYSWRIWCRRACSNFNNIYDTQVSKSKRTVLTTGAIKQKSHNTRSLNRTETSLFFANFNRFFFQTVKYKKTKKQSEPADLRQRHVVCQVAAPYSVWQRFSLCPIESNVNENFKMIQNPGFLSDHSQNWITGSFCHSRHSLKISERSVHNFLSYLAHTQTDRQTDKQTNKVWQKHNLFGGSNKPRK